jgi:hypothetical protein
MTARSLRRAVIGLSHNTGWTLTEVRALPLPDFYLWCEALAETLAEGAEP